MVAYPNLISAMAVREITSAVLASSIGVSQKTFRKKLNGDTEFKFGEAEKIQAAYFPDIPILIEKKEKLKGIYFKISEEDRKLIEQKMELAGVRNMSGYLRKMAIDGYVINLELPELTECVRLARYTSNNVNQIARAIHSGGGVYPDDVNDIRVRQDETNRLLGEILERLSRLK